MVTFQFVIIIFYVMMGIELTVLVPFIKKYDELDKPSKYIFYYLLISFVFAVGSVICGFCFKNNLWLLAIMNYVQFIILSLFYKMLFKNYVLKTIVNVGIFILSIIALSDFLFIEGAETYNSIFVTSRNIVLIIYGLTYFIQLMNDENLLKNFIYMNIIPTFWFNTSIFIYLGNSFMFNLGANYLQRSNVQEQDKLLIVLGFTYLIGIIQVVLLYMGLLKVTEFNSTRRKCNI